MNENCGKCNEEKLQSLWEKVLGDREESFIFYNINPDVILILYIEY